MNLERYDYSADETYLEYEFVSDGPNGRIAKIVRYTKIDQEGKIFNLGFGDKSASTGLISDLTISNNRDRDKVLATVVATLGDFNTVYPNASIYVEGSTASRTRLYQMGLNLHWSEISRLYEVYGAKDDRFELFKGNVNYDAFLVKPK